MSKRTTTVLASAALLVFTQQAAAQTWAANSAPQQAPENYPPPIVWPELRKDTTQTWVGIRHNNTDGTVVGVGVRTAAYPSVLLQLEVVPPGYGPTSNKQAAPPASADNPKLQTTHKLSLRYRF